MFRFRLERVLQHRRREADARAQDLAHAQAALQAAEAARAALADELQDSRSAAAAARQGRLDPAVLARLADWHEELESLLAGAAGVVETRLQAVAAARRSLQEAWRRCEVLERLETRQRAEWQAAENRRERLQLDEIGAIRAALSRRSATPIGKGP